MSTPSLFFNNDPAVFNNPTFEAVRDTMKQTCSDPQVVEVECKDGLVLYIRYKDGELTVKEKWNGNLVGGGRPLLERNEKTLTFDRIEFYLEMYSKFTIKFV